MSAESDWVRQRQSAIDQFMREDGMTRNEATNAVEGFPLTYGSGAALSPAEYERVRVFGIHPEMEPFDDSEGMRDGVEAIGIVVLVVIAVTVIVGLAILSQHLPWVNQ